MENLNFIEESLNTLNGKITELQTIILENRKLECFKNLLFPVESSTIDTLPTNFQSKITADESTTPTINGTTIKKCKNKIKFDLNPTIEPAEDYFRFLSRMSIHTVDIENEIYEYKRTEMVVHKDSASITLKCSEREEERKMIDYKRMENANNHKDFINTDLNITEISIMRGDFAELLESEGSLADNW